MKKMKNLFLWGLSLLVVLAGCAGKHELVRGSAQRVADAFMDSDMAAINEIVFGWSQSGSGDEVLDTWGENDRSEDGVLSCIFGLVSIKVGDITDSTIEYVIEAPDMGGVFEDVDAETSGISEEELLDRIKSYAQNAEAKKTNVSLEYSLVDGEPVVNYRDKEFVNAVTGGLVDAYEALYSEMLEAYAKGLKQL